MSVCVCGDIGKSQTNFLTKFENEQQVGNDSQYLQVSAFIKVGTFLLAKEYMCLALKLTAQTEMCGFGMYMAYTEHRTAV